MITLIPSTLKSLNIEPIVEATELTAPVAQIGNLKVHDDRHFLVSPHLLTQPAMMGLLQLAHDEGYEFEAIVGGGSTDDLRSAASAWAFLPMPFVAKVSLDTLIERQREQQSARSSKTSIVEPTMRAMKEIAAGRPGAAPAIKVVATSPNDGDWDADEIETEA